MHCFNLELTCIAYFNRESNRKLENFELTCTFI